MPSISHIKIEHQKREPASTMVVNKLMGFVKAGQLMPGDQLPSERELASMFGLSRPTIREALKALAILGVLDIRHGGGVFVSRLKATELLQPLTFFLSLEGVEIEKLYFARRLIEGEIAALAAMAATRFDIAELESMIADQVMTITNAKGYRDVDTAFHAKLGEISDNAFLARAAQSLNILGQEFRVIASETPEVLDGSISDHKRIVKAISRHDSASARLAMADHMDFVLTTTRLAIEAKNQD